MSSYSCSVVCDVCIKLSWRRRWQQRVSRQPLWALWSKLRFGECPLRLLFVDNSAAGPIRAASSGEDSLGWFWPSLAECGLSLAVAGLILVYHIVIWYHMISHDMVSCDIIWYHMIPYKYYIIWQTHNMTQVPQIVSVMWYHMISYDI